MASLWVLWVWEADVDSPESSQEHLLPVKRAEPSRLGKIRLPAPGPRSTLVSSCYRTKRECLDTSWTDNASASSRRS